MSNNVNHPSHYTQGDIECIDALKAATVGKKGIEAVCVANVIKYLFRYETKNGLEDVKKAQWYLNRLIQELEEIDNTPYTTGDCRYCKFNYLDSNVKPCLTCKNCYAEDTNEHKDFPLKFQPRH